MSQYLTSKEIDALLDSTISDIDEEDEDISDEEFVPQPHESRSNSSDTDEDNAEDIEAGSPSNDASKTHMESPSGDRWNMNVPSSRGRSKSLNVLTSKSGVTAYATARITDDPCSAFDLIFDRDMMKTILTESNKQGKRTIKDWKLITENELRAYVGLCILRGVYRARNQAVRQLWNPEFGPPIFSKTMAVKRFENIRRVLRFDDPKTRESRLARDKLAAVRLLLDGFVQNSQRCYSHTECVTVDEQLYPYRGRCRFIQYMPSKPAKYGLKFWLLADSNNYYVSNIQMYTGKDETRCEELGMHVVLSLTRHLYGTGRNVTSDNFFTSLKLARKLSQERMTLVGTIRNNKREVPKELREVKQKKLYESTFVYSDDGIQMVSYKAKRNKNVVLLSSQYTTNNLDVSNKRKPETILYYNATKGGVDCVDERVSTYSVKYTSKRWHVPVWCNILDLSCYNAYVLYTDVFPTYNHKKSHKRRLFLSDLGIALCQGYKEERYKITGFSSLKLKDPSISDNKKRTRCEFCPRTDDKKTSKKCDNCNSFICQNHTVLSCPLCSSG